MQNQLTGIYSLLIGISYTYYLIGFINILPMSMSESTTLIRFSINFLARLPECIYPFHQTAR